MTLYAEDLKEGDELPTLEVEVGPVQMFFYSAAAYNGHRIHYDRGWTKDDEGYPDLVIQGHLQAALLARAVTDWIGGSGRLVRYATQNRGAAFAGETLRFRGTVTALRADGQVDLALEGQNAAGRTLMPGTATIALPHREAPEPETPEHETPEHETPEHEAPEHEAPSRKAAGPRSQGDRPWA